MFEAARCLSMDEGWGVSLLKPTALVIAETALLLTYYRVVAVAEERFRTISHHYNPECEGNK